MSTTVFNASVIDLPKVISRQGSITSVHNSRELPFDIKRVFYFYDIPSGGARGAHAHISCHQFLIAVSGTFEVNLDDSKDKRVITLNRPYTGLHIPPGLWASENNFTTGSICLVLASDEFDEGDYIRDYGAFKSFKK